MTVVTALSRNGILSKWKPVDPYMVHEVPDIANRNQWKLNASDQFFEGIIFFIHRRILGWGLGGKLNFLGSTNPVPQANPKIGKLYIYMQGRLYARQAMQGGLYVGKVICWKE